MTTPPLTLSHTVGPSEPAILELTLGDVLRRAARERPDTPALVSSSTGASWTFAELLSDAEAVAKALVDRFEPRSRVSIWAQNLPEWVVAEYAIALAGMVIVTVNPNLLPDEAAYVFNQSKSSGVIASSGYRGRDLTAIAADLMERCPSVEQVITLNTLSQLVDEGRSSAAVLPSPDPGDLVMIQYTSGTTGFPKGASLHHRGLVTNGLHSTLRNGSEPGDVMLGVMPLFHTGGSVLAVLASGTRMLTLVTVEEFEPGHVLDTIERYKVTLGGGVPTMLIAMMEHPTFADRDLSSLRTITSGGSTVPAALVERFEREVGAKLTIVFGQTEMSPVATMTRPDDAVDDKANTLGTALPHVEIKIVDADGNTVPIGEPGEFCARGYLNMLGYNDNPQATAETIDADGWLHSGDICSMDERGYCYIVGRLKDMIIRGGENIYPREIEEVLFRHPSVAEIAVIGLPDDKWGEIVGAVVRPTPGTSPTVTELQDWVRQHLSRHKTPVAWFNTDTFPLTGSGKIQKFRLVEMWQAGELSPLA
ncbi:MAG: AMP-binding protein [Actinomycetota bacterium]|nr:AMP-binding protein [Actinomycetota bacterium]